MTQSPAVLLSERPQALLASSLLTWGSFLGVPSGLALLWFALPFSGTTEPLPAWAAVALWADYFFGALLIGLAAWTARRALGLGVVAVAGACVLSTVIPLLLCVLAWSLHSRLDAWLLASGFELKRLDNLDDADGV